MKKTMVKEIRERVNEIKFFLQEQSSVSREISAEAYQIFDEMNAHIKNHHKLRGDKMYEWISDEFTHYVFNDKNKPIKVHYIVVNCYTKEIFDGLKDVFDDFHNSFSRKKDGKNEDGNMIILSYVALRDQVSKTYKNIKKIVHEFTHCFQYYKSGCQDNVKNRTLYDIANSVYNESVESGDLNSLRFMVAYSIYLSTKSEIDAFIQMLSEFLKMNKHLEYQKSAAYKNYAYIKNTKQILEDIIQKNDIKTINDINNTYKSANVNLNKIIKILDFGENYYIEKIGKVLSFYFNLKNDPVGGE